MADVTQLVAATSMLDVLDNVHKVTGTILTATHSVVECDDFLANGATALDNLSDLLASQLTDLIEASPRYWLAATPVMCEGYESQFNTPVLILHVAWRAWLTAHVVAANQVTDCTGSGDAPLDDTPPFAEVAPLMVAALTRLPNFDTREWEIRLRQEWAAVRRHPLPLDQEMGKRIHSPLSAFLDFRAYMEEWMEVITALPERWAILSREERLSALQGAPPVLPKRRMKTKEADKVARRLATKMGDPFFLLSETRQQKLIGCGSLATWQKTPFYKEAVKKRVQLTRNAKPAAAKAKAVRLTDKLQGVLHTGDREAVLNELIANPELRQLVDEQVQDQETDTVDDVRPRTVYSRKRQ